VYEDGEWKINHHHSSIMPEGIVTAEPITKDEVRDLFQLWNGGEIFGSSVASVKEESYALTTLPSPGHARPEEGR